MKRNLTLAEQKERETLASRVYAATASWEFASAAYANADKVERAAWCEYLDARYFDHEKVEALRLAHMLAQSVSEQASKRMEDAWAEREDALEAEKDFRTRMDARPALTCAYCEAEAEIVREDEALCGSCDAKLQAEWDAMLDEQERDYNAGISGGLHRDR